MERRERIYREPAARTCQNLYLDYRYVKIFSYAKNYTTHHSNVYTPKASFHRHVTFPPSDYSYMPNIYILTFWVKIESKQETGVE